MEQKTGERRPRKGISNIFRRAIQWFQSNPKRWIAALLTYVVVALASLLNEFDVAVWRFVIIAVFAEAAGLIIIFTSSWSLQHVGVWIALITPLVAFTATSLNEPLPDTTCLEFVDYVAELHEHGYTPFDTAFALENGPREDEIISEFEARCGTADDIVRVLEGGLPNWRGGTD